MGQDLGSLLPAVAGPSGEPPERDDPRDGAGAVAKRRNTPLLADLEHRGWPQASASALGWFTNPHPDAGLRWDLVTPTVEKEAKAMLPLLRRRARVAAHEEWHLFFRRVAAVTANPPMNTEKVRAFDAFVDEVMRNDHFRGCPAGALADALSDAQCEEYFPKPAALLRILAPRIRAVLAELRAAEEMARGNVLAKARDKAARENPPASDEERAKVRISVLEREKLHEEQARAARERMRAEMAANPGRPVPHEDLKFTLQKEFAELLALKRRGAILSASQEATMDNISFRLWNMRRMEEGERPMTWKGWEAFKAAQPAEMRV